MQQELKMLEDTNPSHKGLRFLKRVMYSQLALRDAVMILFGKRRPSLSFKVLAEPSSVYINFSIKHDMAREFASYINLSEGFSPVPIRCLAGEEPALLLTLNIYEVSGIVRGTRAEWSTYIADRHGIPRYMVLEARAGEGSLDPVNFFTRADRVEHVMVDGTVQSTVASVDGGLFISTLRLDDKHPMAEPATEWIAANDYIYWRNGVCDRSWYDASLFDATVHIIPPDDVSISDGTHWARFVQPQPRHVLQYDGGLDLVLSPWFNI
jgi:hypothetical protein